MALIARTPDELEETASQIAEMIGSQPEDSLVLPVDVTDQSAVEDMAKRTLDRFGRIDILVNNAGIAGPIGVLQNNDTSAWMQTMQVNVIGPYLTCRAVIPTMVSQCSGKIINLAGAGANNGWANLSAYCTSKAAVVRLTDCAIVILSLFPGGHSSKAIIMSAPKFLWILIDFSGVKKCLLPSICD